MRREKQTRASSAASTSLLLKTFSSPTLPKACPNKFNCCVCPELALDIFIAVYPDSEVMLAMIEGGCSDVYSTLLIRKRLQRLKFPRF